ESAALVAVGRKKSAALLDEGRPILLVSRGSVRDGLADPADPPVHPLLLAQRGLVLEPGLGGSVTRARQPDQLGRDPEGTQRAEEDLGLIGWHASVVAAVDHERGCGHVPDVRERRRLLVLVPASVLERVPAEVALEDMDDV